MQEKNSTPTPRVILGPLKTATQIRMAFKRLGQAVLDGRIAPKVAGTAAYCVAGAGKALEIEIAERLSGRLLEHQSRLTYTDATSVEVVQ